MSTHTDVRTVGVEEELLLVDAESGVPRSLARQVLRVAEGRGDTEPEDVGGSLGPELQEQQVETDTPPHHSLDGLQDDVLRWREKARSAAASKGALILASGTTPLPAQPQTFDDDRYARMTERFGLTATEQLTCGCHVHVSVADDEEAVAAMDRIRPWLPVLLALSANSPLWHGADSGYESYRAQVISRWPTSGPTTVHGSARAYSEHLQELLETGVPLDEGMAYYDARPSRHYPTLEVRVADVCLDARDAVLVAALSRALVETAVQEWKAQEPPHEASVALLRLAMWQASKAGTSGVLLDPQRHRPEPARAVVDQLLTHVRPALETTGDLRGVEAAVDRIFGSGTGAARQRTVLRRSDSIAEAVIRLGELTAPAGD